VGEGEFHGWWFYWKVKISEFLGLVLGFGKEFNVVTKKN
jgi:hypothetical protein